MQTPLPLLRRQTKWFIDTQPVEVTLTPRNRVKVAGGGTQWELALPRKPQIVRLNEPGDSNGSPPFHTENGIQREVQFIILGEWDALIEENDVFNYQGDNLVVVKKLTYNGYEQRGLVVKGGW